MVLKRYTPLPVVIAQHDQKVIVNHVYVMPQNALITVENGVLKIRQEDPLHRERKPIDC